MARCAWVVRRLGLLPIPWASFPFIRAHGVVVSHPLCMRKALGSIPSVSISARGIATHKFGIRNAKQSNGSQHWWYPQVGNMNMCAYDIPPSSVGRAQGP